MLFIINHLIHNKSLDVQSVAKAPHKGRDADARKKVYAF